MAGGKRGGLNLQTQLEDESPDGNTSPGKAFDPSSASSSHAAVSPQSTIAPSFHTASSWVEKSGSQDSAVEGDGYKVERKRSQPVSPISKLSVDTSQTTSKPDRDRHGGHPLSPVSPRSLRSPTARSPPLTSPTSPTSPRNRTRSFSLRRSALARNTQGGGAATELQTVPRPVKQATSPSQGDAVVERSVINFPAPNRGDGKDTIKSASNTYAFSSLPHYESWVANKNASNGLSKRLRAIKEQARKKILRIKDIPPSQDGRHLQLNANEKKPLIDDRTGSQYIDNTILSSRYNLYNFLPRQLFAQFSKLANFYFLCVSILQMIPGLSTTGTYTTIVPLLFFVTISIAKEGYDDLRRYRLDKAENNRTACVLHATSDSLNARDRTVGTSAHWAEAKWRDIRVGDIVKLSRNDAVPSDIVLLQATGTEDVAYIETMALDGETNLKSKQPSPPLARSCKTTADLVQCNAHFVVEDPNLDLYNFEGKVSVGNETLPLTNNEIVYRGSIVRNTSEVTGMVIYTGEECKIRMNATKNPRIKAVCTQHNTKTGKDER